MTHDRRLAAVTALIELADSSDVQDRIDAGRALANFAPAIESRESLLQLVLDPGNVAVTRMTAEALLRRNDAVGLAIVAEALASADVQHSTYIDDAVKAAFMLFASERDDAIETCKALSSDPTAAVRQGVAELREMLTEVDSVLYPHEPA